MIAPSSNTRSRITAKRSPSPLYIWAITSVITTVAVIVAVSHFRPVDADDPESGNTKMNKGEIAEVQPSASSETLAEKAAVDTAKVEAKVRLAQMREAIKDMTAEEKARFHYEYLKETPLDLAPKTNMPFRTGVEVAMCKIFMTQVGDPPPAPPASWLAVGDEARLAQILMADNPVIDGDSKRVQEAKEKVELAKKEFKEYIKEGGEPQDFLPYYYSKLQDAWNDRHETAKEIVRLAREEPEIAREFYEAANERLIKKGIKPVELSESARIRLGLEDK